MPFEARAAAPRRIAVIGAGISGMGAAYDLARDHHVTLFEAEPRLGGHARTVVAGKNGDQPVDTGFIVFNYANYPHMAELFAELDVPVTPSNMSFAATFDNGGFEYGLASLGALFAQKRNALDPRFLRMVRDIWRFNARAVELAQDDTLDLRGFLKVLGTGDWFRDRYLLPLSGAIWSTPADKIMDFPAQTLIRFFENHALLNVTGQHQWFTVQDGSIQYVSRLEQALTKRGARLRPGTPIEGVKRTPGGVAVRAQGAEWESFDDVVFATHSDDTLRLLSDPTEDETRHLGAIAYQPNRVVLHADETAMPRRKICWSSWNYVDSGQGGAAGVELSYWMNCLQPIPQDDPMFVTLNSKRPIREDLIYDEVTMRHPVYDLPALRAQTYLRDLNGTNNTWFCGAWMRNGFHEDGLATALAASHALRARHAVAQPSVMAVPA